MVETRLAQLGFSEKEIAVYLTVLKRGKVLPAEVATITQLNRSTVYSVANELKQRGVLREDLGGPIRYLLALPPEELMQLVSREEVALQKKRQLVQDTIQDLQSVVASSTYSPPKITFITQAELRSYLQKRTLTWNASLAALDNRWWGFQDHTFVDAYSDWIDWYWTNPPKDLHTILLSNRSDTERAMKKRNYADREILFWKEAGQFTSTVWVAGEYLILVFTREEPHYLVEIHDAVLAANMREVFKGIWKTLRK